jgi:hypothetical protein
MQEARGINDHTEEALPVDHRPAGLPRHGRSRRHRRQRSRQYGDPCAGWCCSRRPRPPPGAACCRPRAGDAWPAVTGPPAVAAGAARRRPSSAGAFRRWCSAAKQSSTTASGASAFARQQYRQPETVTGTARGTNRAELGRCGAWLERPAAPRRAWVTASLGRGVPGWAHRPGYRCCPSSLQAGSRSWLRWIPATGPDPDASRKKQEAISCTKHSRRV